MNSHYERVAPRAGHRCEYCRAPEVIFNFPFEVEHIIPLAHQGPDHESNLALACRSCNSFKADYVVGTDDTTRAEVRLFHPRQDRWDDHFAADLKTGEIRGLTPVGRATVARLRMNTPVQVEARRRWMRLRLFP